MAKVEAPSWNEVVAGRISGGGWKWLVIVGILVLGGGAVAGGWLWQQTRLEEGNVLLGEALELTLAPPADLAATSQRWYISFPESPRFKTTQEKIEKIESLLQQFESKYGKGRQRVFIDTLRAHIALAQQRPADAENLFRRHATSDLGILSAGAWEQVAGILESQGKTEEARSLYQQQAERGALGYRTWFEWGAARLATSPDAKQAKMALYGRVAGLLAKSRYLGSTDSPFLQYLLGEQGTSQEDTLPFFLYFITHQSRNKTFLNSIEPLRGWVQNRMLEGDVP